MRPALHPLLLLLLRREPLLAAIIAIPTPPRSQARIHIAVFIRIPPRLDSRHRRRQLIRAQTISARIIQRAQRERPLVVRDP